MRFILLIILILSTTWQNNHEYHVSLSYYSTPVKYKEWSISIYRQKKNMFVDINKFRGIKEKRKLTRESYIKLIERLNKNGIWSLKDFYSKGTRNCYYIIEVKTMKYKNRFKVEAGPLLSGKQSVYREIIRLIINTAKIAVEE